MNLLPGTRLGSYEIVAPLGAGGMGEVYRARDMNLGRDVAIKIIPPAFAGDPERLARFEREARTLASLNHSSIAQIHGLEDRAIVMELVDGEDLSAVIARGPLALDEALAIARQIAEALDAAHTAGIIHRDLKPANVKVRPDGNVKVLDFGLAKALDPPDSLGTQAAAATITSPAMTMRGVILGTAAYMSPEQAKGKPVDERCDIWAFGCLLYEMLTGTRAFGGEDITDTIAAVVTRDPDWTLLPVSTPDSIRRLLRRCLAKPVQQRLRSIGDAALEITDAARPGTERSQAAVLDTRRTSGLARRIRLIAAVTVLAIVAVTAWMAGRRQVAEHATTAPVVRLSLVPPAAEAIAVSGNHRDLAISRDGGAVAYVGGNGTSLIVRRFDRTDAVRIDGAGMPHSPFFSPDGTWVGFVDGLSAIKRAPARGGPIETITRIWGAGVTADWEGDTVIFAQVGQLYRVPANGGAAAPITPPPSASQPALYGPKFLPGGNAVLVGIVEGPANTEGGIGVVDLRTNTQKLLISLRTTVFMSAGLVSRFVLPDRLIYRATADIGAQATGALRVVGFDVDRLETKGQPIPLDEPVLITPFGGIADLDVAENGTLVYVARSARPNGRRLVWVARDGREEPIDLPERAYAYPNISPDGRHVAFDVRDQENDTWIWDTVRNTFRRLTFGPEFDQYAVWTRDQKHLVHIVGSRIFWQPPDGSGAPELLATRQGLTAPYAFSKDDRQLVFREDFPGTGQDLMLLSLADRKVQPLLQTQFSELNAEISPDGRWMVFESDESGGHEIYVRPFPDVNAGRWQVSTAGGRAPQWSRDGRELFFLALDGAMMAARVDATNAFVNAPPTRLFEHRNYVGGASSLGRTYDVAPDGRFLMSKPGPPPDIAVVLNWAQTLVRAR